MTDHFPKKILGSRISLTYKITYENLTTHYAMQESWNCCSYSSWTKLPCSKIALQHWVRTESLKQKARLSVIAWLKKNLATPTEKKFASTVVDWTEHLYSNWWNGIASVQVSVLGGLPGRCQLCYQACFWGCCGDMRNSQWAQNSDIPSELHTIIIIITNVTLHVPISDLRCTLETKQTSRAFCCIVTTLPSPDSLLSLRHRYNFGSTKKTTPQR